jgi:nitrite reductase/ring-hydroxylating ferredoxin subunit
MSQPWLIGITHDTNPAAPPPGTDLYAFADLADPGSRGFYWRKDDKLFGGFIVRKGEQVFGYVDACPHALAPLAMAEHRYLTRDGRAILCSAHGALFEPASGVCLGGPGGTGTLLPWPVEIGADGMVRTA